MYWLHSQLVAKKDKGTLFALAPNFSKTVLLLQQAPYTKYVKGEYKVPQGFLKLLYVCN